jgi:hypothetical protein
MDCVINFLPSFVAAVCEQAKSISPNYLRVTPEVDERNGEENVEDDDIVLVIDENIKKTKTGFIFNHGSLLWIHGAATYVVDTKCIYDGKPIHIYYTLVSNKFTKKYGYYDEYDNFIEYMLE